MNKFESDMELEEAKENGERWLLTYSDMITLLLALFIILYSISVVDAEKFKQISSNMNAALNNPKTENAEGGSEGSANVTNSLDKIAAELNAYIQNNHLASDLNVSKTSDYVRVTIKDSALFVPDKSVLLPDSIPIIDKMADVLKSVYPGIDHITISGHTADTGADTLVAWSLSSERAIAVLTRFIDAGMDQEKFSIEGNSHYSPVAPNNDEHNRSKNRRVEITVTKNAANGGIITLD